MKRASRNAPQANKPMMAFSPTCRWKGHFERFRRRWGSKHFMKALGSLSERASLGPSSPVPRLAGGKANRRHPTIAFSSTGKGKRESQAPHDCLFLDRQGEKGIASAPDVPMIPFSSTGRKEMNFMRICWGRPPGLGLAIGRARRQAGSLCLSDSAEGGIALPSAIPPKAESLCYCRPAGG